MQLKSSQEEVATQARAEAEELKSRLLKKLTSCQRRFREMLNKRHNMNLKEQRKIT